MITRRLCHHRRKLFRETPKQVLHRSKVRPIASRNFSVQPRMEGSVIVGRQQIIDELVKSDAWTAAGRVSVQQHCVRRRAENTSRRRSRPRSGTSDDCTAHLMAARNQPHPSNAQGRRSPLASGPCPTSSVSASFAREPPLLGTHVSHWDSRGWAGGGTTANS